MKKLLQLCIVSILILSGVSTVAITNHKTNDVTIKTESLVLSIPVLQEEDPYITVNLEEATSNLADSGKPLLPVVTKVLTFPFGTKICNVDVRFSKSYDLVASKKVIPATEPPLLDARIQNEPIEDSSVYQSTALYPQQSYSYTTGAGLDGIDHVMYLAIHCYPIRYSPAQNMLFYSEQVDIQVTYEEPMNPTVFSNQYELVIISPSDFSNDLQPLIDHKNSMGVNTTLKTTEAIYSEYSGFDDAEKIKYFIQDAIETWGADYILLIGSATKLPIRTTWFHEQHHEHYWNETVLSDLYYADIYDDNTDFCSWDSNGNGLYGEVFHNCPGIEDIIDFYPDIHIGRFPCDTNADVKTITKKVIHYETETAGESWFNNMIFVGGDTFPGWGGNEGEQQNVIVEQIMSDFTPIQLWTSDNTFTARSLNQAINNGAGFIDYSGHGFEIGVATHPPDNDIWVQYLTYNLLGALNGYKLPIIFFDACLTSKLDFNISELIGYLSENAQSLVNKFSFLASQHFPTFGWSIVKKRNGGAIATVGATRTAFGGIQDGAGYMAIHFFQGYSTSETVSMMLTNAQNDYITYIPDDRFTVEEFILIGDPSLKIGGY